MYFFKGKNLNFWHCDPEDTMMKFENSFPFQNVFMEDENNHYINSVMSSYKKSMKQMN